ncbi:MAG: GC-type dockerin domain-anchored protein [Phycisphaerales bacterium]
MPTGPCSDAGLLQWNAQAGESFLIRCACDPQLFYGGGFTLTTGAGTPPAPVAPATVEGADIVTGDCWGVTSFGTGTGAGGQNVRSFGIGGDAWNRGTQTLAWRPGSSRHPVIAQNMYRSLNGRLDNLGVSWLKHGFASENATRYGPCVTPFGDGYTLGTNCSDAYTSSQNGDRDSLGPRWDVNPMTGTYTWNWSTIVGPTPSNTDPVARRLQVPTAEWNNPGAEYWVDVHYVTADDATWNNGRNNVAARRIVNIPANNTYASTLIFNGSTTEISTTALQAWANRTNAATPGAVQVSLVDFHELTQPALDVNGAPSVLKDCYGQFQVYSRVTDNGNGTWNYLYGVYNVNSHRAAAAFSLRVPTNSTETGYTFKAPLYHSGERIDNSLWLSSKTSGVRSFAVNPSFPATMNITGIGNVAVQPNYVYWGSMYTMSFTSNTPPTSTGVARLKLGRAPANATGYQGDTLAVTGLKVPTVCTADVGSQGGLPGPDGSLDNNDFIAFISAFFDNNQSAADLGAQGGLPGADNALDNNDFIAFINAFFTGC